ncbi:MAG: O-antigen ligase family protein [Sedimentisphaerales bacterium]|nr:O-antigen ligase family protein [Sedimentisphaerales bacterium]
MNYFYTAKTSKSPGIIKLYTSAICSKRLLTRERVFITCIMLSTLVAAAGKVPLYEISIRGWAWVFALALSAIYLLLDMKQKVRFPWYAWLPWFLWMAYKTDFSNNVAVQRIAIFLTPVLVASAASSFRKITTADIIKKSYLFLLTGSLCIYVVAAYQSRMLLADIWWYPLGGVVMTFTLIAVSAAAGINETSKQGHIIFFLCFLVLWFTQAKMPMLILPVILVFGYTQLKWRSRLAICVLFVCAGLVLFPSEAVQEVLFRQGSGTINDLLTFDPATIKAGGRLTAWPMFIQNMENIWFGQGNAASVELGNAVFGEGKWSHPHNEYIRIVFEYGIVGIVLFAIPVLWILYRCHRLASSSSPDIRWLNRVSAGGIVAMLLLSITGNALMYAPFFGNMLFLTIGCAFSVSDASMADKVKRI